MKLGKPILLLMLCTSFPKPTLAQNSATYDSPEQVAKLLRAGTDAQKARLKDALHLPFILDRDCGNSEAKDCFAEAARATLEQGKEDAILKVKYFYDFDLIVLRRSQNGTWRYLDSMPLSAAYDYLTVSLQSVVNPPVEDIVVHMHVSSRGTGIFQANFLVVKIIDGRLRVVLDTIEECHLQMWNSPEPPIEQRSAFKISSRSGDTPASIEEKQTLIVGGQTTIGEREFDWDDDLRTFQVSLWWTYKKITRGRK